VVHPTVVRAGNRERGLEDSVGIIGSRPGEEGGGWPRRQSYGPGVFVEVGARRCGEQSSLAQRGNPTGSGPVEEVPKCRLVVGELLTKLRCVCHGRLRRGEQDVESFEDLEVPGFEVL